MITSRLDRTGFTLVEMMIVIALLGIMLAIAIPAWMQFRPNTDLRTAARGVTGDFYNMKQRAVGEQTPYRIAFDRVNQSYQLINDSKNVIVQTKNFSEFDGSIELTTTFPNDTVNFFTRGTASPGSVTLTNTRNSTATITVNITGRTNVTYNMQ